MLLKESTAKDRIVFGSHNVYTVEMLKSLLDGEYAHHKNNVRIGQLQGFSDQLTYDLAS